MKLSYFPQLKVIHTSKIFHGQLYIPLANWLLMVGTIMVASIYNNVSCCVSPYVIMTWLTSADDQLGKCVWPVCDVCDVL